jgi:phage antirepressor YoqD-like protein
MAKEISMIQRSDKGRKARQYFIDCERRANQPAIPQSFSEALLLAGKLQQQIEQDAPKVAHYDAVVERGTLLNATQVAHSIGLPSAQALNKKLERMGVYNGNCKRGKEFRAWFIEKGLGDMKQASTGHQQPLFTTKGQAWIFEKLNSSEVA